MGWFSHGIVTSRTFEAFENQVWTTGDRCFSWGTRGKPLRLFIPQAYAGSPESLNHWLKGVLVSNLYLETIWTNQTNTIMIKTHIDNNNNHEYSLVTIVKVIVVVEIRIVMVMVTVTVIVKNINKQKHHLLPQATSETVAILCLEHGNSASSPNDLWVLRWRPIDF